MSGVVKLVQGNMLHHALMTAAMAHDRQVDKSGMPYILHVFRVVDRVKGIAAKQAAALHDVLEESDLTAGELVEAGYTTEVVDAVKALTRMAGETYAEYIVRVRQNSLATEVKLADLRDNLDRLTTLIDPTGTLRNRYTRALAILRGDLGVPLPD